MSGSQIFNIVRWRWRSASEHRRIRDSSTPGTPRNDYSGWVGMSITVGTTPLEVSSLGRFALSGNVGGHVLKIVSAGTGADVPGGTVNLAMGGSTAGSFVYGSLPVQ